MTTEDQDQERKLDEEEDTEGHGLLADADYYLNRKMGRDAEMEREVRDRQRLKEARPNKPGR